MLFLLPLIMLFLNGFTFGNAFNCSTLRFSERDCVAQTGCAYLRSDRWSSCESASVAKSACASSPKFTCMFSKSKFVYTDDAAADQVTSLPGLLYDVPFNQFSGYINLPGTKKQIHYWFVEAEVNPESAPVVFWTNGGPGCSGLIGFLTEQGPFRPDVDGVLQENPYAWNKVANMVFLEQPVGVGFSYSDNEDDYKIGDDQAAQDNLATVRGFLAKFPHLKSVPLYITSESYGGHYMPTLAVAIINFNDALTNSEDRINFRGFAVGNPYTDYYSGVGAEMETYWGKQLLPKPAWDVYVANGCITTAGQLNNSVCSSLILDFMKKIGNLNPYALDYPVCLTAQQRTMHAFLHDGSLSEGALAYEPCEDQFSTDYLNRDDVKSALHVRGDIAWDECSRTTKYELKDKMLPMEKYYRTVLESKTHPDLRVLVYSGDDDSVCGTIGTQRWIYDLGYPVLKKYDWTTWTVDGQTAGYVTKFSIGKAKESRFSFVTVHFAGHEVPTYKPKEALDLFEKYLNGEF